MSGGDPTPPVYLCLPCSGTGYGGSGFSPYGSPPQPPSPEGGYGEYSYGLSSYGSVDNTPPRVNSAISLDGFRIEVFFSEAMRANEALFDPDNYLLTPLLGAPTEVTSVLPGTPGDLGGFTSVVLCHCGTTLAGTYDVQANNIEDLAGNSINDLPPPANETRVLTFGDVPTVEVEAKAGDNLRLSFLRSVGGPQEMLPESEFTPGIEDINQYETSGTYPIPIVVQGVTHPAEGDLSKVDLQVTSMTSAEYDLIVGPASAILYDGSVLPSDAADFDGVEVGTGTSSADPTTRLQLNKTVGNLYGWDWQDTSGRLLPGSSYRADFTFDATTAVFTPPLFDTNVGSYFFNDGAVEITFIFARVAGVDVITINSGSFSSQVPATWSTQATTVTVVRNQKAEHVGILINGEPVISVPVGDMDGAPTILPGARFILSPAYDVAAFTVDSLNITSSQTLFTSAWNFLHNSTGSFTGSAAFANDRILTKRGPLVKGWGDATPATKNDVTVRLNGLPIPIRKVNPYIGAIFPEIPIPLAPAGTNTIEVDYKWFPNPKFPLAGLNTPGLVLNKWDHRRGHNPEPASSNSLGVASRQRFPMAIGLAPTKRPQPVFVGHRYLAYERKFTALLNSPTTLRLNQSPHRVSLDPFQSSCKSVLSGFDGNSNPTSAEVPWALEGVDSGSVVGDGTYRLVDALSGSFGIGEGAYYYQELNLTCPSVLEMAGRFLVEDYVADGVFTGVGWGFHNNHHLYLVGALVVNGLRHVGLLTDGERPDLASSWVIGPSTPGVVLDNKTISVHVDDLPSYVGDGSRFQILEGPQTGVYTIEICGVLVQEDGTAWITIKEDFPADPTLEGNDTATVLFEVLWDEAPITLRGVADVKQGNFQVFVGGSFNNTSLYLDEATSFPAETSLFIRTGDKGQVFWGSLSREATNTTLWSFFRYAVTAESETLFSRGVTVTSEMEILPQDGVEKPWFVTNAFGYSEIDASGDTLLLKSTSGSLSGEIDLTFGYARIEPFLTTKANLDVDAEVLVETGTLGAGDAVIRVRDDIREARLSTILYDTDGLSNYLLYLNFTSLSGLQTPVVAGWSPSFSNTLPEPEVRGQILTFSKSEGQSGTWSKVLAGGNIPLSLPTGRVIEARLRFLDVAEGTDSRVGFGFSGDVSSTYKVAVTFKMSPNRIILTSSGGVDLGSYTFDWNDGEYHTLRVLADTGTNSVILVVDDVVVLSLALNLFDAATTPDQGTLGGLFSEGSCTVEVDSFHVADLAPAGAQRTLGVYLGGDETDINNWSLPRTDATTVPNSDVTAVIEPMDWTSLIQLRLRLDARWGVSIYRPDMPAPPWFTGNFITNITDPTAAWINVEYRSLPRHDDVCGSVAWGALNPSSITQQRWDRVAYRIFKAATSNFLAPQGMVLNRYNVIHSGEFNVDFTPEVVTITSQTARLLSIRSAHQNASRVFNVVVDGVPLPSTQWVFDEDSQTITLADPLPESHYPVTVTFAPGKPITETYLCRQPFERSVTKLNEGTPPVPLSQASPTVRQEVSGVIEFTDDPDALYNSLSFCQVDDGGQKGLISIACDGPAPEQGWIEMGLNGTGGAYLDPFALEGGPGGIFGSQSPSIAGSAKILDQTYTLMTSGKGYNGGVLAGGVGLDTRPHVLHPNAGSGFASAVASERRGLNQEVVSRLVYSNSINPLEDDFIFEPTADNTPPSVVGPEASNPSGPDGVQGNGAAVARIVDPGTSDGVSRLGPWGGYSSLESQSLLAGGTNDPSPGSQFFTLNGGSLLPGPTTTNFTIEAVN